MADPLLRQAIELADPYRVVLDEDHVEISDDRSSVSFQPADQREASQLSMALRLAAKRLDMIADRMRSKRRRAATP